ncbi:MAG: TetR/AcrR family transcriptional regulator [Hyphomicrobiales bacterium]|nr:TetR/AcrR family transcriptional regulator [Hyphomicrobiales bacterium]
MAKEKSNDNCATNVCAGLFPRQERPRERIVTAAQDMFYRHGFRAVGVDAIAEAAGTNKMTLYRHFGSKDDLIIACLTLATEHADAIWTDIEAANPDDPIARLRDWVVRAAQYVTADEPGCDLANAAVELREAGHPALDLIIGFKQRQRDLLVKLCRDAGATQPDLLADALFLLLAGARVSRRGVGAEGPSSCLVRMCETIFESFGVRPRAASPKAQAVRSAAQAR